MFAAVLLNWHVLMLSCDRDKRQTNLDAPALKMDTLLGRPTLGGKVLSLPMNFRSFLFYQSTVLSSHAEDGQKSCISELRS